MTVTDEDREAAKLFQLLMRLDSDTNDKIDRGLAFTDEVRMIARFAARHARQAAERERAETIAEAVALLKQMAANENESGLEGGWIAADALNDAADRIQALEAENERPNNLINETANHWLRLQCDHPVGWVGAIDTAMEAACDEIRRLSAALKGTEQ